MTISSKDVKDLREKTGAGMMNCKKALEEASGNVEKAMELLRKKGQKIAAEKSDRETKTGLVDSYIHPGGRIGVLVEVVCETDFVAKNRDFKQLVHNLCMQIAAMNPLYVSRKDIPKEILDKEKEIEGEKLKKANKPKEIVKKIIERKLEKFYQEVCLLDQPFIKDEKKKISNLITESIAKIGENIQIKRFIRYELGEGTNE